MNINRHNYEEWFLMYIDNELGEAEKKAVEAFVNENPDLQGELVMLKQSIIKPEKDIVYTNKELLMQPGLTTSINTNNYQEYFLLYADDELSGPEKSAVEQFVYNHPELQEEFELWHEVKMVPEKIVFKQKENLYRFEETKIVPFKWWGIAVAASVLLVAGYLWLNYQQHTHVNTPLAEESRKINKNNSSNHKDTISKGTTERNDDDHKSVDPKNFPPQPEVVEVSKSNIGSNRSGTSSRKLKVNGMPQQSDKNGQYFIATNGSRELTGKKISISENMIDVRTSPESTNREIPMSHADIINHTTSVTKTDEDNNEVRTLLATNDKTENIFLTNIPIDHNPSLRGLLRKASRVLDKVTAIRNGSRPGISIGNVEIAIQ